MTRSLIKVISFFMLLLALAPAAVSAQAKQNFKNSTPEQRAEKQSEFLGTQLQLNDAQREKVNAINLKYSKQMDGVMKGNGTRISKLKSARKLNQDKEAEYKAILTPDQIKQYDQIKKELRDKMKEKRKSEAAAPASAPVAAPAAK
ncbi:hypothetical protein F0L74_26240 [Chitinophaga agrisoli]|uniref:Spy/CpxP family protein refolding chaperone n=1 Tax=Chitinophaga agrisoli TaxID=2607653 RepID=A0A5B2VLG0_9BACT|nr:hypothetical protein [Chitinophaga agrisoli]KAA2239694.1 hypothetical protein F0L74_26240 [Chitinophaga agrisoli]